MANNNDIMKILLQAELATNSTSKIQDQIEKIQKQAKPVKIEIDTKGATNDMSQMSRAIDDASKMEREYGRAIKMRMNEAHAVALQINKSIDDEKRKSAVLEEQIELFKRRQEIQAKNIETRYKDTYDVEALAKYRQELQKLDATDPKIQSNMKRMRVNLAEINAEARNGQISMQSLGQSALGTVQKFAMFAGVSLTISGFFNEIRKGVGYISELDASFTEIGIVLGKSQSEVSKLGVEYAKLATDMKVTTTSVADAAVAFYRQGLNEAETMERMETAVKYAKISNTDFTSSVQILTATVNSMNIDIDRASDVFSGLGDAAAISSEDIGKAMSKVGGSAGALGIEFEKVASQATVIMANTQESAESIGHGLASIYSRMSQMRQKGFDEEDGTQINDVAKALSSVGIELMTVDGKFNDFGSILDTVGEKWETYSDKQKAYVATSIAGVRNQTRFLTLMDNYSTSIELYDIALQSAGTTQEKYNIYLESTAAAMDELKNEAQKFWMSLIDSGTIKTVVGGFSEIIKSIGETVTGFGAMNSIMAIIIPVIGIKLVGAVAAGNLVLDAMLLKTIALTGGLAAIPLVIMAIYNAERKREEAFAKSVDSTETLSKEVDGLERLSKEYNSLMEIEEKSAEQKERLLEIQKELAEAYPQLATGLDAEGNKIVENTKLIDNLADSKKKLLEQELLAINNLSRSELPELESKLQDTQKQIQDVFEQINAGSTRTLDWGLGLKTEEDISGKLRKELEKLTKVKEELTGKIETRENALESYNRLLEERREKEKWIIASEIEKQSAVDNSIEQTEQMEERLRSLGFTSDEITMIISGNLSQVVENHEILDMALIESMTTVTELDETTQIAYMNIAQKSRELTLSYIEDTKARINAIKSEMTAVSLLSGTNHLVKKAPTSMPIPEAGKSLLDTKGEMASYNLNKQNKELSKLEENLSKIDTALSNVSGIKPSGGVGSAKYTPGGAKKKEKKKKKDYKAEADAYAKINLELERSNVLLQLNKTYQDQAGSDLSKKIPLLEKEIELNKQRQELQHRLNTQQREEQKTLEKSLSKQGFNFTGEGDNRTIGNLEQVEGKSKEVEEQFKRYIALQKTEIPKASQEWWNLQNAIDKVKLDKLIAEFELADKTFNEITESISELEYELKMLDPDDFDGKVDNNASTLEELNRKLKDTTMLLADLGENGYKLGSKESDAFISRQIELTKRLKDGTLAVKNQERALSDLVRGYAKEMIEAEKRNAYMDLELRQRRANERIKSEKDRLDSRIKGKQEEIDDLQSEIDDMQESERVRAETLERAKRLEEISKLQEKHYHLQYTNLENMTEEQAKLVGLEKEREQYLERQTRLQELQLKLTNLQREKNIKQLTKKSDGTWDFEYTVDQKAVDGVNNQIESLQKEHSETTRSIKEKTLEDLKKAQESYDEWERQNELQRNIKNKQQRIREYQDEIKDMQDRFAERERVTNEAFANEKENLDRYYMDMDMLTDEKMAELYNTFDGNWSEISKMMTGYFDEIGDEYKKLVSELSKPLPNSPPSSGNKNTPSGSGGKSQGSSGSTRMVDSNGKNVSINNNVIDEYLKRGYTVRHKGGIVGDGSRDLPEIANALFNTKPNEQMVKALKGELFVPAENLSKYFIPNMRELLDSVVPPVADIPRIPNFKANNTSGISQSVTVKEIVFPNVKDAKEIETSLKSLSTYANQWANRK